MPYRSSLTLPVLAAGSMIALMVASLSGQANDKPAIVGSPSIVLDPQSITGSVHVDLRNDQVTAATLHLSVSPAQDAGQAAHVVIKGQAADKSTFDVQLNPHAQERIWIDVSNAEADDFDIDLFNGSDRIAKIPVKHKPFNVHPTDAKSVVSLYEGKPTDIKVTSDDRASHDVIWRLRLDGRDACGGRATLAPKSPAMLTCVPKFDWSRATMAATLFRPQSWPDAALILERPAANSAAGQPPLSIATLPVYAQYFDVTTQQSMNYVVVVAVLVFGGVVSLLLGQIIPNRLSRIAFNERIDELHRTISGLGDHTDSSLRVLLRVERSRLVDVLRSRTAYSPEYSAAVAQTTQGLDRLTRRVVLVQRLEAVIRRVVEAETTSTVSWTQVDQSHDNVRRAQAILRNSTPTDAELLVAEKAVADAAQQVESSPASDAAFQAAVAVRVDKLKVQLATLQSDNEFGRVAAVVPEPVRMIRTADANAIATSAISIDRAATKLDMMIGYVRHRTGVTDSGKRTRMDAKEGTFLGLLQNSNLSSIVEAGRVIQQIRDDIYPASLLTPLGSGEAQIQVDPSIVYERIPLQFSIRFTEPAIDRAAAARAVFQCEWDFGDKLKERGWEVTHYYVATTRNRDQTFSVRATFTDEHGQPVPAADGTKQAVLTTEVTVRPPRDRRRLGERSVVELLKLAAALLIAVFGLVAGARDQIAKLDVLPGLIAVFLIGFGADTIKSLLSSKT